VPAPGDLVPREDNVKVTLSLSRRSLDFFKREARKRRVPYQLLKKSTFTAPAKPLEHAGKSPQLRPSPNSELP
jgi:hypothetical protein